MTIVARVAAQIFNTPLLVAPGVAELIATALADRLGVEPLADADLSRFVGKPTEQRLGNGDTRAIYRVEDGVALINVFGELVNRGPGSARRRASPPMRGSARSCARPRRDPDVRSIVLDIDSPAARRPARWRRPSSCAPPRNASQSSPSSIRWRPAPLIGLLAGRARSSRRRWRRSARSASSGFTSTARPPSPRPASSRHCSLPAPIRSTAIPSRPCRPTPAPASRPDRRGLRPFRLDRRQSSRHRRRRRARHRGRAVHGTGGGGRGSGRRRGHARRCLRLSRTGIGPGALPTCKEQI